MSMKKPILQQTCHRSTAVTDYHQFGTYNTVNSHMSHLSFSTTHHINRPMVKQFQLGSLQNNKPPTIVKHEPKKYDPTERQPVWTDTRCIQTIIDRTIETDIELSKEQKFSGERYFFNTERVCAQKELPIPYEVKEILKEVYELETKQRPAVFYGYLSYADAVYYLIGEYLYVYKVSELKEREELQLQTSFPPKRQPMKPVRIKQNCRKIHEVIFSDDSNGRSFLQLPSKYALIMEYPYQLEIVNYKFEETFSRSSPEDLGKISSFSIINLGLIIKIESKIADFITITPGNSLLYLDENLKPVNCWISGQLGRVSKQRQIRQRGMCSFRQYFVSRNYSSFRKFKQTTYNFLTYPISLQSSKKKNLALVYDEKTSLIYTLTIEGDRSTYQQLKKEFKVYQIIRTKKGAEINGLMSTTEEHILSELKYPIENQKVTISTIIKGDPNYHQQASLLLLMSNGDINYLIKHQKSSEFKFKSHSPLVESLREKIEVKREDLTRLTDLNVGKDANGIIISTWEKKHLIKKSEKTNQQILSYFNDHSLSIGLIRSQNKLGMFLTVSQNNEQNYPVEVFQVDFKNQFFNKRLDNYPSINLILEIKSLSLHTENSSKVAALQSFEVLRQLRNGSQLRYFKPKTQESHETLRQIHHGPRFFAYISNNFISNFSFVRPIDIVYYLLKSQKQSFCKNYLPAIIGLKLPEICCMLLQIYSAPSGTPYFIPKKYKQKIEETINGLHIKLQKNPFNQGSYEDRVNLSYTDDKKSRNSRQNQSQKYDELVKYTTTDKDEEMSIKIRNLFAHFSGQQNTLNHNVFENIKIKSSSKSHEQTDLDDSFNNLQRLHKIQAKNCLLYISRVLYPFWNTKCLTTKKGQEYLMTVQKKVQQLFQIKELLKLQTNEYWKHLDDFLSKLSDIIQIFISIPKIPEDLTLSEAMSKSIEYFEPFIFESFRHSYHPSLIRKFKDDFPFYITKEFEIYVNIYNLIADKRDGKEIRQILERRDAYPQYFINYLKKEKPYVDLSGFFSKEHRVEMETVVIERPDLPFKQQMNYYFKEIEKQSVKMMHKFKYLEIVKRKLQEVQNPHLLRQLKQNVDSSTIMDNTNKYQSYFKCIKFQQKCIQVVEERGEEYLIKRQSSSKNQHSTGFFTQFFAKLAYLFNEHQPQNVSHQNLNSLSTYTKRRTHEELRSLFEHLNSLVLLPKDFLDIIEHHLQSPYLKILYMDLFWNSNLQTGQLLQKQKELENAYRELVKEGFNKFEVLQNLNPNYEQDWEKYRRLITYIRTHVDKIVCFMNSIHSRLHLTQLYNGVMFQLFSHNLTLLSIALPIHKVQLSRTEIPYNLALQMCQLSTHRQQIFNYIYQKRLLPLMALKQNEKKSQDPHIVMVWIYECCILADMVCRYKKQDFRRIMDLMMDFQKAFADFLERLEFRDLNIAMGRRLASLSTLDEGKESDVLI